MFYYLYKITNWFNGKIYIGVHKTSDLNDGYMGSGKILKAAIEKYGAEYFTKEILQQFDSAEEMFEAESQIVNEEFVKDENTYNIKLGGYGGFDHLNYGCCTNKNLRISDPEWQKKNSPFKNFTKKQRIEYGKSSWIKQFNNKIGLFDINYINPKGFKDKHHSEEAKQKIGLANSIHQSGSGNSQFGTCWIYNLELKENKKIKKDELEQWLASGWIKGRKQNFR